MNILTGPTFLIFEQARLFKAKQISHILNILLLFGLWMLVLLSGFIGTLRWSSVCRLYEEDAAEAVRICEALLEEPELDPAVRMGDAFGFLVEHHCQHGNFQVVTIIFSLPRKI